MFKQCTRKRRSIYPYRAANLGPALFTGRIVAAKYPPRTAKTLHQAEPALHPESGCDVYARGARRLTKNPLAESAQASGKLSTRLAMIFS